MWAAVVRVSLAAVPLTAAVGVAALIVHVVPPATGPLGRVMWWTATIAVSGVASYGAARAVRRFLPLSALLRMTLVFPDQTPSRFRVALRVGQASARGSQSNYGAADVLTLSASLSHHDRPTRGHSERVRAFADVLGKELGLSTADRHRLCWVALLHDIGKLSVPGDVLNKRGPLCDHEWDLIRRHPLEGDRLIASLRPWLGAWGNTVAQHHERLDGSGYPEGLRGDAVGIGARIVAVADTYDVITAARSYKRPMSADAARVEISRHAGTLFDPDVTRALLNVSLGRLRWIIGPLGALAAVPFLGDALVRARPALAMARVVAVPAAAVVAAAAVFAPPATSAPPRPPVAAPPAPLRPAPLPSPTRESSSQQANAESTPTPAPTVAPSPAPVAARKALGAGSVSNHAAPPVALRPSPPSPAPTSTRTRGALLDVRVVVRSPVGTVSAAVAALPGLCVRLAAGPPVQCSPVPP